MGRENIKEMELEAKQDKGPWVLKSTPHIVTHIFFERHCTAGILTILPLFLHHKLELDKNTSTSVFHTFECLMLLTTIFGTIVADTWLGLYQAVIITSLVYVGGLVLLTTAMIEPLNLPIAVFVAIGLSIMVIGSGGLKNNLNAFGGGQHKLPEQKKQLETYFSVQYFGVKCGSFLARLIFPMIRADVKCFGKDDCYAVSFGIPALIMLFATIIFLIGTSKYKILKPNGNMIVKVCQCIKCAVTEKGKSNVERKVHWLDYAEDKFGKKLVRETRIALKVILVSLPAPIFWSGLMQQRSRWIFQATRMDGDLGWYTIKPDQMIVINSLMAITMIPILDKFVYPLFAKVGIKTMLQRLVLGGVLIVIAFLLASILEMQTQKMTLSILWQLPQYFVIGIAEILTYLSHLNFAYKEAPPSMKPVMMSLLYLSMAGGDLVVAIFSSLALFPSQAFEYAFYSGLVLVAVIALMFLANRYENSRLEIIDDDEEAAKKALTAKDDEEHKEDEKVENATPNGK